MRRQRVRKTINDKTRQQEGRQDKTRLKKKPQNTITIQDIKREATKTRLKD